MITFYPGPSKVYPQVEGYLNDAYHSGMLSANHRSAGFMELLKGTIKALKSKLDVPEDYEVYLVSSATECWEIIAQSLIEKSSYHIYNGAFGEKWLEYTQKLHLDSLGGGFDFEASPLASLVPGNLRPEVVCVTHNETSNGTALPDSFLHALRNEYQGVIAVDATSSMGGVSLPWLHADVWYASVQKCFGLPAGMGVMIVSPKAIGAAAAIGERAHYNSLLFVRDNFLKFQTPYTPNTLGIYLLGRVMEQVEHIAGVAARVSAQAAEWYRFLLENGYKPLIMHAEVRSDTVIAVSDSPERVATIKKAAQLEGIMLGNGYGAWKESTFRIANFPAISPEEIATLQQFLKKYSPQVK